MDLVAGLVAAVGAGFLVLGLHLRRRTRRFIAIAERAPATAVGATARTSELSARSDYSQLQFTAADGNRYRVESRLGLPGGAYARGRSVDVLYDPEDPSEAVVDSVIELHAPWLIFAVLGAGWLLAGLLLLFPWP